MKFSIIVPIYNAEGYLEECIKSILGQSMSEFELILVNDGSTDESISISQRFLYDKRVKIINKKNEGITKTIIAGINEASGQYIGFVDADDIIDRNLYQEALGKIETFKPDVIIYNYYQWYTNKKIINNNKVVNEGLYNKDDIYKYAYGKVSNPSLSGFRWNKIYKKSKILEIKPYLIYDLKNGEDDNLSYLTLYSSNSFYYINKPLYYYRARSSSIMNTNIPKFSDYISLIDVLKRYTKGLIDYKESYINYAFLITGVIKNSSLPFKEKRRLLKELYGNPLVKNNILIIKNNYGFIGKVRLYLKYHNVVIFDLIFKRKQNKNLFE